MFDHKINETVIFNRYWIGRFSDRREDSNPTTFHPCVLFDGFSLSSVQNYPRLPKKNFFKLIFQLNRNSIKSDEKKVVNRNKIRGKWSFWRLEFFLCKTNERRKFNELDFHWNSSFAEKKFCDNRSWQWQWRRRRSGGRLATQRPEFDSAWRAKAEQ